MVGGLGGNSKPLLAPVALPQTFSAADVLDFQENTRSHSAVAGFRSATYDLSGAGEPLRVDGARVSFNLSALLGRGPRLGRIFTEEEDRGAHRVTTRSACAWPLGADRGRILRDILGGGFRLVAAGVAIGLLGGIALSRLVSGFLYGVAATDMLTYAAAAGVLVGTGLFATWIPARRAAAVDPMVALRQE